jgi:hypothetical protein
MFTLVLLTLGRIPMNMKLTWLPSQSKIVIVNLDPANDVLPYECGVNVNELIQLEEVMREFGLGPNGGIIYCLEYLLANVDWLLDQLKLHKGIFSRRLFVAVSIGNLTQLVSLYAPCGIVMPKMRISCSTALAKSNYTLIILP